MLKQIIIFASLATILVSIADTQKEFTAKQLKYIEKEICLEGLDYVDTYLHNGQLAFQCIAKDTNEVLIDSIADNIAINF